MHRNDVQILVESKLLVLALPYKALNNAYDFYPLNFGNWSKWTSETPMTGIDILSESKLIGACAFKQGLE